MIRLSHVEIIHVAAELAPVAKVGGLGDVLHGLSRALLHKSNNVKILLPKYDTLDLNLVEHLEVLDTRLSVRFDGKTCTNTLWQGRVDEIPVVLIESHDPWDFFKRDAIYGFEDDTARFTYFCMAALAYLTTASYDCVHLHDWHTALIAALIKELHPEIKAKVIFTIHNLAYQGQCQAKDLEKIGWKSARIQEEGTYNLLKGGIIFSDCVTTVSPTYAKEIMTTELGGNLRPLLQQQHHKVTGILNGIDYTYWNPETDPLIPAHYSLKTIENKSLVKREVKKKLCFAQENVPLVGAVTRLVPQKGPELIKAAILRTLEWGGQFILLGSASDEKTRRQFYNLKKTLSGCAFIHFELTYNEELSHILYAAADLLLIPSIFEPCGLTQQIAMRYGTIPLARATGGLVDTILEGKNGFMFGPPTAEAIHAALDRAFAMWYDHPVLWHQMMKTCMQTDFSWDKPAEAYLKLYSSSKVCL